MPRPPKTPLPGDIIYANPAPLPTFHLDDGLKDFPLGGTNKLCSVCKEVTITEWITLKVVEETGFLDITDLIPLFKRLTLCTQCGTYKLIT